MSIQQTLFGAVQDPPAVGYKRYEIVVAGVKVYADYNPNWMDGLAHIEFQSLQDGVPNPISETGYLSHFVMGSVEPVVDDELVDNIRSLGEQLAHENGKRHRGCGFAHCQCKCAACKAQTQ